MDSIWTRTESYWKSASTEPSVSIRAVIWAREVVERGIGAWTYESSAQRVSAAKGPGFRGDSGDLSDSLPARGARLLSDDKEVGWLTSVTTSPTLGRPIALGYVRREHGEPGTRLRIDRPDTDMIAGSDQVTVSTVDITRGDRSRQEGSMGTTG